MEETTTEVDITKVGEEDTMTDMAKEVIKFLVSFLEILIKKFSKRYVQTRRGACDKRNGVPEDVMQKKAALLFALLRLVGIGP